MMMTMVSEHHAVSDRAAAEIASAVLHDHGIVTAQDVAYSQVVDDSFIVFHCNPHLYMQQR